VASRVEACHPAARVRLGLLVNPRARTIRGSHLAPQLARLVGDPGRVRETHDLASLRRALAHLLCVEGVNVLALAGGDGTVHFAVNALLALSDETEASTGTRPPLPRLLVLDGGTLNIVARTLAIYGPPPRTLGRFLRYFHDAPLRRVPARRLDMMRVASPQLGVRHGFVFGSEVAFHAMGLYDRFGGGYGGLGRFLGAAAIGYLFDTELWRTESWKLDPPRTPVSLTCEDGEREFATYSAVVASTVDLTLARGALRTIRRPALASGFFTRVVTETRKGALLRMIPGLMTEAKLAGVSDFPETRSLLLRGPYTLDGEIFGMPEVPSEAIELRIDEAQARLFAIPGEMDDLP